MEADGFKVATGVGQQLAAQWFNLNPAAEGFNMFRDPRLRWAFGLSVDRDVVNDLSMDGLGKPSVCNTSTESWAIREGANYYDPPDLAKAAQLRDAAGFGDDNPVTGDILSYSWDLALLTAQAVFAQLQQAGWSGLNFVEGSESAILDRFFPANDHVTATLTWNSPFDPDATMTPTVDLVLKNWMYGSPADGPGTGRASLADYPNDQVLQDIAETEEYTMRPRNSPARRTASSPTTRRSPASATATPGPTPTSKDTTGQLPLDPVQGEAGWSSRPATRGCGSSGPLSLEG